MLYAHIRSFFWAQDYLEVETPLVSRHASTEVHLDSLEVTSSHGHVGFLPTSPEYPMKRLLAAWKQPIFQISKSFRAFEVGARHNSEFTMLEWYTPDQQLNALAKQLCDLLSVLGVDTQAEHKSYAALFGAVDVDVFQDSIEELYSRAHALKLSPPQGLDRLGLLDLIFSMCIEPSLGDEAPLFVTDFLPEQASLAALTTDQEGHRVAARFELYYKGLELANAFQELNDPDEQRARFEADNQTRKTLGKKPMPIDEHLLVALEELPACCGIAVGLDRLLMCLHGHQSIQEVLTFDSENA